jgi:hypothetical protein
MPLIQLQNKLLLFVHIPKTGGASVEQFFRNHGRVILFDGIPNNPHFYCSPQHFHLAPLKSLFPLNVFHYRFTIVRNPFTRLVSEYRMRQGEAFLAGQAIPNFDEWCAEVFDKYLENSWVLDNHLRPQTAFINEQIKVLRFEEGINSILQSLQQRFQLPEILNYPHKQKSVAIPVKISPKTVAAIVEFYSEDFAQLPYSTEIPLELNACL